MRELEQASAEAELGSWAGSPCHVSPQEEQLVRNEAATRFTQHTVDKRVTRDEAPWPKPAKRPEKKYGKQTQSVSYCVPRTAYCENKFKKV